MKQGEFVSERTFNKEVLQTPMMSNLKIVYFCSRCLLIVSNARIKSLLLALVSCITCLCSTAQRELGKPARIEWHNGYRINQTAFSFDGQYLLSIGDDNSVIITDIGRRAQVQKIENLNGDFLEVSPLSSSFYTISSDAFLLGDSLVIQKRKIPTGEIVQRIVVPKRIGFLKLNSFSHAVISINFKEETFILSYVTEFNSPPVIIKLSSKGEVLQEISGVDQRQINAIINRVDGIWVLTSHDLWKQENRTFRKILQPSGNNNNFSNLQQHGDTLILLSNKEVQWYDAKQSKVVQSTSVANFFSVNEGDLLASSGVRHHPFCVDTDGSIWLVNTRTGGLGEGKLNYVPIALAKVGDKIAYPFNSREKTTTSFEAIQTPIAFHPGTGLLALIDNPLIISLYDKKNGYLFQTGRKNLQIKNFSFTSTPGRLFLESEGEASFCLDLVGGRMETVGSVTNDYFYKYKTSTYRDYKEQHARELIYSPSKHSFIEMNYVFNGRDLYLKVPHKDTCIISVRDKTVKLSEDFVLQLFDANKKQLKELQFKGEKQENLTSRDYLFDKYSYDSTSHLLTLFWKERLYGTELEHVVDIEKMQLVKQWNLEDVKLINGGKAFISGKGIFTFPDSSTLATFSPGSTERKGFTVSRNQNFVFYYEKGYSKGDKVVVYDISKQKATNMGVQFGIKKLVADPHSNFIYTIGNDQIIKVWDPEESKLLAEILLDAKPSFKQLAEVNPSYVVLLPEGYYMGGNKYYQMLALKDSAASYPVFQMDAVFHRPDKVLKALKYGEQTLLQELQQISERRAARFAPSPLNADIRLIDRENIPHYSSSSKVSLRTELRAINIDKQSIMVYVNGTALWSRPGKGIEKYSKFFNFTVELVDASNYIRICLVDKDGKETAGDYVYINAAPVVKRDLYVVGIGISQYADNKYNLKYAEKDMTDLLNYLKTTTSFQGTHTLALSNSNVSVNSLDTIKAFLSHATSKDIVLCYFAGHGLLDKASNYYLATYNMDFNNPAKTGISVDKLNAILESCASRKKVMLIDACHSGLIEDIPATKPKLATDLSDNVTVATRGIKVPVNSEAQKASSVYFSFNYFNQGNGVDILAASAGNEYAFEMGNLKNGIFTYSLISGFKSGEADIDKDGSLSINELQTYVSAMVKHLSGGAQQPSFRQANLYQDIQLLQNEDSYVAKFMGAASSNQLDIIKLLLKNNEVQVNQKDKDGFTALHYASRQGSFAVVKYLTDNGADVNLETSSGFSALSLAVINAHVNITYYLLNKGAKKEEQLQDWMVKELIKKNDTATLRVIKQYQNIKAFEDAQLALVKMLAAGNIAGADSLFSIKRLDVDHWLIIEETSPVLVAIASHQLISLEWLIKKGCNLNLKAPTGGLTPLMIAAYYGYIDMVVTLIRNGADRNIKDNEGKMAIDYAKDSRQNDVIKYLQ